MKKCDDCGNSGTNLVAAQAAILCPACLTQRESNDAKYLGRMYAHEILEAMLGLPSTDANGYFYEGEKPLSDDGYDYEEVYRAQCFVELPESEQKRYIAEVPTKTFCEAFMGRGWYDCCEHFDEVEPQYHEAFMRGYLTQMASFADSPTESA